MLNTLTSPLDSRNNETVIVTEATSRAPVNSATARTMIIDPNISSAFGPGCRAPSDVATSKGVRLKEHPHPTNALARNNLQQMSDSPETDSTNEAEEPVVDDYALCFTKPDRSNANTPQSTPLYVPSEKSELRTPSTGCVRSGKNTPSSPINVSVSGSVTSSPQVPEFPPSPPSMATDLTNEFLENVAERTFKEKQQFQASNSPVLVVSPPPSLSSPLDNAFNYQAVSSDPPVFALSSLIFTQSINHHYSTPLPEVDEMFPWLHGIHEDNFSQRAFLDPLHRFRQEIPANGREKYEHDLQSHKNVPNQAHGLLLVKITSDPRDNAHCLSHRGTLIGSVTVDEILKRNPGSDEKVKWSPEGLKHDNDNEINDNKNIEYDDNTSDIQIAYNSGDDTIENEMTKETKDDGVPTYSQIYLPQFLELDTRQGISLRNFQIQVTKFACISDVIIYCSESKGDDFEQLIDVARLISQAQINFKQAYSLNQDYKTFVVFDDFATLSALSPHIVSIPLDLDESEYEEHRLRNWDSNLLYHERIEMAMMSSASLIGPNIWLGNTMDFETYGEIERIHQLSVAHKNQNYLSEENLDVLKTRNWTTFIDCRDSVLYTSQAQLDQYIDQTINYLTRSHTSNHEILSLIRIHAPASGTLNMQTLNENDIIYLLKVCKLIYFRSLCGKKQQRINNDKVEETPCGTLIFCNDGYTETSALALCYLIYSRKLTAPEAWLELHVKFRRPFFCFSTDCTLLSMITNVLHNFSPLGLAPDDFYYDRGITRNILHQLVTVPSEPSLGEISDNSWFHKDFDGSFPSRVLPHVYLGSLVHAENIGMLQKLGIKRVLSVGEPTTWSTNANFYAGKISQVLYIDHLQDDGVDLISDSLQQCLEFLDEGYQRGEITLVHCRVGVSRSATVCIAEVMKRLGVGLPRAYLFVRVRRLNVIIQPNLKLMFELVKWEERSRKYGEGWLREVDWHIFCREISIMNKAYIG